MGTNNYIRMYNDFVREIKEITTSFDCTDSKATIKSLPSLSLKGRRDLFIHVAEQTGTGDNSYFYVDKDQRTENLFNYLSVNNGLLGVWELYLLMSSSTIMPCFWHGAYNQRRFIFSGEQLAQIDAFNGRDISLVDKNAELSPSATLVESPGNAGATYEIKCCYWNDWNGLMRETVRITIDQGSVKSYEVVNDFPIYKYDCGMFL